MPGGEIRLRGVRKAYREAAGFRRVLHDVDLDVAAGEFIAITGPSGSGKSTLLNIVAAIESADAGSVTVGGTDLAGVPEPASTLFRRRHLGIVFQFFNLVPTLTVRENLLLPARLCGLRDHTRVDSLLERVGLADRADSFPDVLSGGEQQRVGVARAMVHRPAIVLADEPTGNLDESAGDAVLGILKQAAAEGATIVMVTHSGTAAEGADRIVRLHHGRLEG
ncbi:MAG: ABC transporter ATP-binding protein [Proteobacteria bacterium]|nr:MAG: ABC transporter ATP-binding protein [Pseudomonadota bacterium]